MAGLLIIALLASACATAPSPLAATALPVPTSTSGSPAATDAATAPLTSAVTRPPEATTGATRAAVLAVSAPAATTTAAATQPRAQLMPARMELPTLSGLAPAPFLDAKAAGTSADEFLTNFQKFAGLDAVFRVELGGKTALEKAYGYADAPQNKPVTLDSRFRIHQMSGSFTAAAVLMLEEQGKLKVEDPVCRHVSDCPAAWQELTVRHLLTHTGGLADYTRLPGYREWRSQPQTLEEMLGRVRDLPLAIKPGSDQRYSPTDLLLASHIVEKVSGMSYEAYLKQAVLDPLGLSDTGLSNAGPNLVAPNAGTPKVTSVVENGHGSTGLYSTVGDLARWAHALMGDSLPSGSALPERVRNQMLANQVHFSPNLQEGWYGYSFNGYVNRGHPEWGIIAGDEGFRGTMYFQPDSQLVAVVLLNTDRVDMETFMTGFEKKLFGD